MTKLHRGILLVILTVSVTAQGCGEESARGSVPPLPRGDIFPDGSPPFLDASPLGASPEAASREADSPKPGPGTEPSPSAVYFGAPSSPPVARPVTVAPLKKGSVVLLVFDALNARHLSAYGYERPTSPRIDEVAGQGLLLTNHVSNSSWTRPSFTTIITGLPKKEHGVELEGGWRLEPEIKTLAERFRGAGYRTAGLTGNPLVRASWGFDQGYQYYDDPLTMGLKAFPRDRALVDRAVKWLDKVGDRPFFLVIFLTSSHPPYTPPKKPRRFLSEVTEGKIIAHPYKEYPEPLQKDAHDRIVAAYDDEVAYMDSQVGRLLDHLKASGRLDGTIIAMTADHGEVFGLHNCYLHAYHMWEPALRVPFILKAPNLPVRGAHDARPFTHVDIAPTLLDLVGIPYDTDELKGISLVRALGDLTVNRERVRFSQYNAHGVRREAIRNGRWKLVHHHKVHPRAEKDMDRLHPLVKQPNPRDLPTLAWDKERYELYDLVRDRDETTDLFQRRQKEKPVLALLEALAPHLGGRTASSGLTEEMRQALINAGYIREAPPPDPGANEKEPR